MKFAIKLAVMSLLTFLFIQPSIAQKRATKTTTKGTTKTATKNPSTLPPIPIEQYTLENGLRVVLSPDNSVPVVSVAVNYDVGSRNERPGRTGFAHLFEHMMFQESENVGKAQFFKYISNIGGENNGTTNTDRTVYYEVVPSNQLPTALWLESDRMRALRITPENLKNQQEAVKEERRLRVENQPYGQIMDIISDMVYSNPANSHSVIGSMDDLNAATVTDVSEFFKMYYAPNNAVLAVAGSFDPQETKALISKYFGSIPSQPKPPAVDVSEGIAVTTKNKTFEDKLAPFPAMLMAWKIPSQNSDEFKALSLGAKLLYEGQSSRLYQKLVKGDESVLQLFGFNDSRRGPSKALIGFIPKPGMDQNKIQQTILNEIKDMAANGPTPEEMSKLKNGLINDAVRSRQTSMSRAIEMSELAVSTGDANAINTDLDALLKITPAQIKAAVNKYLNTENRSQLNVVPAKGN